jgi:hypothetical protein
MISNAELEENLPTTSTPSIEEFDPRQIPFQYQVLKDIHNFNYSNGILEILLSGSVGSAKSILLAHIIVMHCLNNPGARVAICRRAMPQLRKTLWTKIKEHISRSLVEGVHYKKNESRLEIVFANSSEIISHTWADGHFDKCRSYELSMAAVEELTENETEDFYKELRPRVGRLPHVKENIIVHATNPDAPSHWAYEYFFTKGIKTRKVYLSRTEDNPFLPSWYIEQLKQDYDPKMARRMIYGEWVEISRETVYHSYDRDRNYIDSDYIVDRRLPVHCSWDFNIGVGKPLSCVLFQYVNDTFHFFDEVVVEGMRTEDSCDELDGKGLLRSEWNYIINGDSTGSRRDTRSKRSDYDIIKNYFANYKIKLDFQIQVPASNGPIRERHNKVNAYCYNENKQIRLFIYKKAQTADKAMRLTQMRKGAGFVEDDTKDFQHIGTAMGYGILQTLMFEKVKKQSTRQL